MVYFIGTQEFIGVENIVLSEIKFCDFCVNLYEFDCLIISSKNALKALMQSDSNINWDINLYAVGFKSAKLAKELGFKNVKYPSKAYGENLAYEFLNEFKNKKCLYLRAKKISSSLDEILLNSNINLTQKIVYENISLNSQNISLNHPAVFVFSAPSSVDNFLNFYELKTEDKIVVIGEKTAKKLKHFKNLYICQEQDLNSCINLAKSLDF
ncbi:uroporphyrinogen-III synthase [Campylobacter volucris]|uniref:Uroporphyrinogen-III synthase n=1 Tax=Campylobacter volucris TaxID=1031542 RepID=A0AAE5YG89_9BACT|nr:uroporphyrinogen-III synthase [Campylobacter volucris]AJC94397.1 uroporphyrinogen III synthase [Campylobacter volucris LMG 24379]KAB0580543.1 uroporphyrinogen-III synthase [Campylobacter volucris]QBL13245.1 uroporphyrinogen-III synthase [Campylobacter volucris]QEL08613.1 uroporphyrinogen III synthase [Campylobacter volucris]TXK70281.1 uroporphyrinogen-III synthase [Campylobacter volucris]